MLFTELNAIMPLVDVNQTVTSNTELNSINMALYDHATFVIQFASTMVIASTAKVVIESGSADSGDVSTDVVFHYRLGTASGATLSTAGNYGADTTASVYSIVSAADVAGHTLILEVDGDELRSTSLGEVYNWITVDIESGITTGTIAAYAILSNPRYAAASMPVAI